MDNFYCDNTRCRGHTDPERRVDCCFPTEIMLAKPDPRFRVTFGEARVCFRCARRLAIDECDACERKMLHDGLFVVGFGTACVPCVMQTPQYGAPTELMLRAVAAVDTPHTLPCWSPVHDEIQYGTDNLSDPARAKQGILGSCLEQISDAHAAIRNQLHTSMARPTAKRLVAQFPGLDVVSALAIVRAVGRHCDELSVGELLVSLTYHLDTDNDDLPSSDEDAAQ